MKNISTVLIIAILLALSGCVTSNQTNTQTTTDDKREVTGRNDWSGYIQGKPTPDSKFNKLEIGMGNKEVMDLMGPPTDQSINATGKAYNPFYFGSGKLESWFYYKNVGRLLFASNAGGANMFLIGIEYDVNEDGYQ